MTTVHMSSLQQRAASSSTTPNNTNNNGKGAFESCFAQGLDLSEFGSNDTGMTSHGSASAKLLPIIQRRAQERHSNDQEEIRLQSKIQARALHIQNELKAPVVDETLFLGSRELTNALVTMHDNDHYGGGSNKRVSTKTHPQKKHNVVKKKKHHGTAKLPQLSHPTNKTMRTKISKKAVRAKYH